MEITIAAGPPAAAGLPDQHLGALVAQQLDAPLVVVDGRLELAWANRAARGQRGAVWDALFDAGTRHGAELVLRGQLGELVSSCLRERADCEALVEGLDGTWFASAAPLHGRAGLVLLRVAGLRQLPGGARRRLQRLFGLSEAEAQVTVQLAGGATLERIAAARGVSVDTVRAQMRSVFHKTGMHRQGELICAVGRLASN